VVPLNTVRSAIVAGPERLDLTAEQSPPNDGSQRFACVPEDSSSNDNTTRRASSPRTTLLAQLAEDLRAAALATDMEAARVAHDAIGRLLGDATNDVEGGRQDGGVP
jgi:hypothetical protein